jgi:hypothetical protein
VTSRLTQLERRRESLIARSAYQRERLAESCEQLARSLRWTHLVTGALQRIKENPGTVIGVTALLAGARLKKFRRLSELLSLGWTIFKAVQARRGSRRD